MTKAERSRNLRYKKPALAGLSFYEIMEKLDEISGACSDIHYAFEDDETLINALDGDEEQAWEFKMAFSALESEAYQLEENLRENVMFSDDCEREFDDLSVALIGNRFRMLGYDDYEEDYYNLTGYEERLAQTEAGKRVMRKTKQEMLSAIGQTLGIILSFQNVEMKYEYIKATIDIFRDENTSVLKTVKEIEDAYDKAANNDFYGQQDRDFDRLIRELPDRIWIE